MTEKRDFFYVVRKETPNGDTQPANARRAIEIRLTKVETPAGRGGQPRQGIHTKL